MNIVVSAKTDLILLSNIRSETTVVTFGSFKHVEETDFNPVLQCEKLVISGSLSQLNKISSQMMNKNCTLGGHSNIHFEFNDHLPETSFQDFETQFREVGLSTIEGLDFLLERLSVSNVKTLSYPDWSLVKLCQGIDRVKYKVFRCNETLPSLFANFLKNTKYDPTELF